MTASRNEHIQNIRDQQTTHLISLLEHRQDEVSELKSSVQSIEKILSGNGDPESGMVIKLDRVHTAMKKMEGVPERVHDLERSERTRKFVSTTAATAGIIALMSMVWSWVTKGGPNP